LILNFTLQTILNNISTIILLLAAWSSLLVHTGVLHDCLVSDYVNCLQNHNRSLIMREYASLVATSQIHNDYHSFWDDLPIHNYRQVSNNNHRPRMGFKEIWIFVQHVCLTEYCLDCCSTSRQLE
ncbi:hypothetical protein ACJX0J_029365, partial [Zea mays]